MANIYKRTRSGGVLGLRPTSTIDQVEDDNIISQEFVGIGIDDEDVYSTSLEGGSRILTNYLAGNTSSLVYANRIDHPELGRIWYADYNKQIRVNSTKILYLESRNVTVYYGNDGAISDNSPAIGQYVLSDGSKIIIIPA